MNVYLRITPDGKYIIDGQSNLNISLYKILSDGQMLLMPNDTNINMPLFVLASDGNQPTYYFKIQPIDDEFIPQPQLHSGSIQGINILTNISGLINTHEFNNIYELQMSIGDDVDKIMFDNMFKRYNQSFEGQFSISKQSTAYNYISQYADRVYYEIDSKFVNGKILIKNGAKQYIPFGIVSQNNYNMYNTIKPLEHLKGRIDIEEDIWIEPVIDKTGQLYINFFGGKTGKSYKLCNVQDFAAKFYGFDFDGQYIYQLIDTATKDNLAITQWGNYNFGLRLARYNIETNQIDSYIQVQYEPIDPRGIKIIGNLLLIHDIHGVVVLELVDTTYAEDTETLKFKHPFDGIFIQAQDLSGSDLTNPLTDENNFNTYSVVTFTTQYNKVISPLDSVKSIYEQYNYFIQQKINAKLEFVDLILAPTYIDSIQYIVGIERDDYEFIAELFTKTKFEQTKKGMYLQSYIYPIPITISLNDNGTYATLNLVSEITKAKFLSQPYAFLTIDNMKLYFEEVKDYESLFDSLDSLKQEIKEITGINNDYLLERSQDISIDGTIEYELRLIDNNRPVQVKYYIPHTLLDSNYVYAIGQQTVEIDQNIYDLLSVNQTSIVNGEQSYNQEFEITENTCYKFLAYTNYKDTQTDESLKISITWLDADSNIIDSDEITLQNRVIQVYKIIDDQISTINLNKYMAMAIAPDNQIKVNVTISYVDTNLEDIDLVGVYLIEDSQLKYYANDKVDLSNMLNYANNIFVIRNNIDSQKQRQHTHYIDKIINRNIQAGRVVGFVENGDKIKIRYVFNY